MPKVPAPAATADLSTPPCRTSGGAPHGPWGRWGGRPRHGGRGRNRHRHLRGPVRRTGDSRVLAGVCGGLAAATGIDVTLVRIAFVLLALGSGVGVLVYALAWLLVPPRRARPPTSLLGSSPIAGASGWSSPSCPLSWSCSSSPAPCTSASSDRSHGPLFLAAGAALLVWRNASEREKVWINDDLVPCCTRGLNVGRRWSLVGRVVTGRRAGHCRSPGPRVGPPTGAALATSGRGATGRCRHRGRLRAVVAEPGPRPALGTTGPGAGRRAGPEMAAHVHDSVLQTLALIQRSADDPQHVMPLGPRPGARAPLLAVRGTPPGHHRRRCVHAGRGDRPDPAPSRSRSRHHRPGGGGG